MRPATVSGAWVRNRLGCWPACRLLSRNITSGASAALDNRGFVEISGDDASKLLQGLVTNDVGLLDRGERKCIAAAFLNPKGRVVADALIAANTLGQESKQGYLLDCPLPLAKPLARHLKLHKLRSKVKVKDVSADFRVLVTGVQDPLGQSSTEEQATGGEGGHGRSAEGKGPDDATRVATAAAVGEAGVAETGENCLVYEDPRCAALGRRWLRRAEAASSGLGPLASPKGEEGGAAGWIDCGRFDALRMLHGVPEGAEMGDGIPLEFNLELLNFVSFGKGCYIGQELTARTHFKGLIRKRLLPVVLDRRGGGQASAPGPVLPLSAFLARAGDIRLVTGAGDDAASSLAGGGGTAIVDRAAGAEEHKVGSLVAASKGYDVGLALVRLEHVLGEKVGPPEERPPLQCFLSGGRPDLEGVRCVPVTPDWWPPSMDPKTGKVPG